MLQVSGLSIHFGGNYLFDNVSFTIGNQDRIGLIGRNGAGKSTLLKIIKGIQLSEEGTVSHGKHYKIGYLPQDCVLDSNLTVKDEAATALSEIQEYEKLINKLSLELGERTDYESDDYSKLVHKLSEANERYHILGGSSSDAEISKILKGLGFSDTDFHRPVNEFSGGWKMRIELAKILISKPDCILLDEPTNHLDIESIRWLELFLKNYFGAVMIVSHDSRFLDEITRRTIEISNAKVYSQNLAYTKFLEYREQERETQRNAYNNQQKKIAQQERFIERFRSKATLATRVQSKVKQLEKMDKIELEDAETKAITLRFPEPPRSGRVSVEMESLSKSFGDLLVLDKINLAIERGEKVAFVGKNGEGKTTLSKIIVGQEDCDGVCKLGHNVILGYYAQHQAEMLNPDLTVFEIIDSAATGDMRSQVRNLLGTFLFSGDDVYKKVRVLSGGEKSRLALAKLLLQEMNLLILDEPTNHLDIISKGVLKEAVASFEGTVIIVSHDRDFLDGLTDKTIEFKNHKIKSYPGDINYFLEKLDAESFLQIEEEKNKKKIAKEQKSGAGSAKEEREKQKAIQRDQNRIKKKIQKCEEEIESLEMKIAELEELFQDPDFFSDVEKSTKTQQEHSALQTRLEEVMTDWETLEEELAEIG